MERPRSNGIILMIAGTIYALVSAYADELQLSAPGYSWLQGLNTFLGSLGIIVGAYLTRFEGKYLAALGAVVVLVFLVWDRIGLGTPGFGCPHSIAIFTGVVVACIGVYFMKKGA